jgi:hypothetical protein
VITTHLNIVHGSLKKWGETLVLKTYK